jgi:hypothetical protein
MATPAELEELDRQLRGEWTPEEQAELMAPLPITRPRITSTQLARWIEDNQPIPLETIATYLCVSREQAYRIVRANRHQVPYTLLKMTRSGRLRPAREVAMTATNVAKLAAMRSRPAAL